MEETLEIAWEGLRLTEEEKGGVRTEGINGLEDNEESKKWLMAKLLTTRSFQKEAMLSLLRVVWRLSREAETMVLDSNLFLFKFASLRDKQRVIDGSLWMFNKHLILFTEYDGDLRTSDYVFNKASFWVRIHDLPLKMMRAEVGERLGNKVGSFLQYDASSSNRGGGNFIRIRVKVDVTKPLRRFVNLIVPDGRKEIWCRITYERLPNYCYHCGLLGHIMVECPSSTEKDEHVIEQYGPWLRAPAWGERDNHQRTSLPVYLNTKGASREPIKTPRLEKLPIAGEVALEDAGSEASSGFRKGGITVQSGYKEHGVKSGIMVHEKEVDSTDGDVLKNVSDQELLHGNMDPPNQVVTLGKIIKHGEEANLHGHETSSRDVGSKFYYS